MPCYIIIQAAVNAANNGDVIDVSAGIYNEVITVNNKDLTINGPNLGIPGDGTRVAEAVIQVILRIPKIIGLSIYHLQRPAQSPCKWYRFFF